MMLDPHDLGRRAIGDRILCRRYRLNDSGSECDELSARRVLDQGHLVALVSVPTTGGVRPARRRLVRRARDQLNRRDVLLAERA